jgi:HlyD family secretion protein
VIFSREERAKLVFLVEALPNKPEALRVGQPIAVAWRSRLPSVRSPVELI